MKSLVGKWSYYLYVGVGMLLVLLTVIFTLIPQAVSSLHTSMFVLQVLHAPVSPQPWVTATPVRERVTYPRPNGQGMGDVYRIPGDGQRAAVLIFLGANAAGQDDPDVVNLGHALARTGYAVMFHWSPTMGQRANIDEAEVENLVWAFRYLLEQDFVDKERVGLGGFSVGASFALVAAADSRIRDDVVFVNSFGGYYSARDLFLQIASRSRFYQEGQEPWEVDQLTWQVFANELLEGLENPAEREILTRRFLEREPITPEDLDGLSVQGQAVNQLLIGTTLEQAGVLYEDLAPRFKAQIEYISPSAHVEDLESRLMIMHDDGDLLIPVVESRRLAEALGHRGNFRYTETKIFDHVRPGNSEGLWGLAREAFKLYRHMYAIVRVASG